MRRPRHHKPLGACCYAEGKYTQAETYFKATLANYPDYTFSLAMLTRIHIATGNAAQAVLPAEVYGWLKNGGLGAEA